MRLSFKTVSNNLVYCGNLDIFSHPSVSAILLLWPYFLQDNPRIFRCFYIFQLFTIYSQSLSSLIEHWENGGECSPPVLLFISSVVLLKSISISFPLIHLQFSFSYSLKKSTSFHLACCNFTNPSLITFQFDTKN